MTASAVVDLRSTLGTAFIGLFVSGLLLGVTIIQAWNYFGEYRRKDPLPLKVYVSIIVFLDFFHTILCFHTLYWYLILNFGNVDNLQFNMWSMNSQGILSAPLTFMVQLLYLKRLYILSKSIIVPLVVAGPASIGLVCSLTYTVREFIIKRYSLYGSLTWEICVGLGSILTADILISLSMSWFLYHQRTGFARTDSTIMSLMSFSLSSGLLTSLIASVMLASFVIAPTSMVPLALYWLMVKFHANSLLAMLNSRNLILERSAALHHEDTFYMGSFRTTQQKGTNQESTTPRPTAISVSTHQTATSDFAPCKLEHDCNAEAKHSTSINRSASSLSIPVLNGVDVKSNTSRSF